MCTATHIHALLAPYILPCCLSVQGICYTCNWATMQNSYGLTCIPSTC